MKTMTILEAQQFLVNYQNINTATPYHGKDGIIDFFNRVQSIQYDPLKVAGTNSDLVLQSRFEEPTLSLLNDALYSDRVLIDGWDKMMGIYLTSDFPHMTYIREKRADDQIDVLKHRLSIEALDYTDDVINIIKTNGPLFSSEIKMGESLKHKWGHTKPSSAALDYLFHKGILGIKERRHTQKKYDILENLIGSISQLENPFSDFGSFQKWYLYRRICSLGLVQNKSGVHLSGHGISNKKERTVLLTELIESKLVTEIYIDELQLILYAPTSALNIPVQIIDKISFIAPLDNLIWDRDLIKKLFSFNYTWEVYVPKLKRKFGYYVLPILFGNKFIGRIEFEHYKTKQPLKIIDIWFEENINKDDYKQKLKDALDAFCNYLDAPSYIYIKKGAVKK